MNRVRFALSSAFALVATFVVVNGESFVDRFELEETVDGGVVSVDLGSVAEDPEVHALASHPRLLLVDDADFRGTGYGWSDLSRLLDRVPAQRWAWCVSGNEVEAATAAYTAAVCFAERACRRACSGADSGPACLAQCPRDPSCAAVESSTFTAAPVYSAEPSGEATHRCASHVWTAVTVGAIQEARMAAGGVGFFATGEGALSVASAGLSPYTPSEIDGGPL